MSLSTISNQTHSISYKCYSFKCRPGHEFLGHAPACPKCNTTSNSFIYEICALCRKEFRIGGLGKHHCERKNGEDLLMEMEKKWEEKDAQEGLKRERTILEGNEAKRKPKATKPVKQESTTSQNSTPSVPPLPSKPSLERRNTLHTARIKMKPIGALEGLPRQNPTDAPKRTKDNFASIQAKQNKRIKPKLSRIDPPVSSSNMSSNASSRHSSASSQRDTQLLPDVVLPKKRVVAPLKAMKPRLAPLKK